MFMNVRLSVTIRNHWLRSDKLKFMRQQLASSVLGMACLKVSPDEALVDETIRILVSRLTSGEKVSITTLLKDDKGAYGALGHYIANKDGIVDTISHEAVSGTYKGVEPMGLFWSMQESPKNSFKMRFLKKNSTTPLIFHLAVYSDHISWNSMWGGQMIPMLTSEIKRWYLGKDIERIEIEEGRIRGTLFIPKGYKHPLPGVIDMYGSVAGAIETRAALLASKGFITLALAYFNYKDLPKSWFYLDMKYFEEAVQWLSKHPCVIPTGIGIVGVSLGGTIASYLGCHYPQVKAVVNIAGIPVLLRFVNDSAFMYGDKELASIRMDLSSTVITTEEGVCLTYSSIEKEHYIQFSPESQARFLVVCGSDDQQMSPRYFTAWLDSLSADQKTKVEMVIYPGAGHLIEPPHSMCCYASYNGLFKANFVWGGKNSKEHAVAQEKSWEKMEAFLRLHLMVPEHSRL